MGRAKPTPFTGNAAEEMQRLQGTWKQVGYERDGISDPVDELGWEPKVTFSEANYQVTLADGSIPIKGTYKLDPGQTPNLPRRVSSDVGAVGAGAFPSARELLEP
jgi:hypothetical protein